MNRTAYKIPRKHLKEIINKAISLSKDTRVDELDCGKSFARYESKRTVDEVLKIAYADKHTHWNFIRREAVCGDEAYFDVGFCTLAHMPEYFLWLRLSIEDGEKLISKYNLETYF